MSVRKPVVHIIAGSNGAGKSTFAEEFLPRFAHCPEFVNPDLIAQGLSPFSMSSVRVTAARLALQRMGSLARERKSFGFETTLSGVSYARLIRGLKRRGYDVRIYYLWVHGVRVALRRVADRVAHGGHDVPAADVKRRYVKSLQRFMSLYSGLADVAFVFDNSGPDPRLLAEAERGVFQSVEKGLFAQFLEDVKEGKP